MRVAIECAGFTPAKPIGCAVRWPLSKHTSGISAFGEKLISGMMARGYDEEFARRTFSQLEGFGSYGFPKAMPPASPLSPTLPPG